MGRDGINVTLSWEGLFLQVSLRTNKGHGVTL